MNHDAGKETKQMQNFLANAFIHHRSVRTLHLNLRKMF